jgi:hypothetical protein
VLVEDEEVGGADGDAVGPLEDAVDGDAAVLVEEEGGADGDAVGLLEDAVEESGGGSWQ